MSQVLYCVFLAGKTELPETGILKRPVQALESLGIVALHSELNRQEIAGDQVQAAALKFHEVVHAVFNHQAVVPFRFPTLLKETELRKHLSKESARYLTFLHRYAEDVQMEVRLWIPKTLQRKPGSGTEYMERAITRWTDLMSASDYVQRIAKGLVSAWKSYGSGDAVRVFAMVARSRIKDFRELFIHNPRPANVAMRVTGPWPAAEFFAGTSTPIPDNVVSITRGEKS